MAILLDTKGPEIRTHEIENNTAELIQGTTVRIAMKEIVGTDRQNNLKKAFIMRCNDVKLDTIVILDDIYTTGSTVDEMARLLRANGVSKIYVVTLAIGRGI